ncbi:MAG: cell surface protein SprA [Saprospiraceae bacterium]
MKSTFILLTVALFSFAGTDAFATPVPVYPIEAPQVKVNSDTIPTIRDRNGDFITDPGSNRIDLRDPSSVTQEVEYDPTTNRYIVTERIGGSYFRSPTYLTFDEYQSYRERQSQQRYFDQLQGRVSSDGVGLGNVEDPIEAVDVENSLVDRLFGGSDVNIDTRGNIDLTFGVDYRTVKNPAFIARQQRNGGFDFKMNIQMNVTGSIGSKLQLSSSYNNSANFNFDRQLIKVSYNAAEFGEDEILQNIEAGNVSLPLRSSLIQGSQGLLGVRADLKFGRLKVTGLVSQQKTERDEIEIQGGAQFQEFEVRADEYDENRHFLLSHFNRETFEESLQDLPTIISQFKINRIEVWITNDRDQTEGVRELVALADLGEGFEDKITNVHPSTTVNQNSGKSIDGKILPDNDANRLYADLVSNPTNRFRQNTVGRLQGPAFGMEQSRDFERVRARLLTQSEFSFQPDLGFVSVNVNVRPDQVLAVAYEYTYNGKVYKVGEFSNDLPVGDTTNLNVLYTRMLKSTTPRVDVPAWDLMMKNFYNIGAYQVNQEDFRLDITYEDPGKGEKRFLPTSNIANQPLIRVFDVDQLNVQLDPQPDGIFDFVPGLTIYPRNGRIMFPVLEPFGKKLEDEIDDPAQRARYVYNTLYDSTVIRAREYPEFNRFIISGSYKSSVSSEISLGAFNIPRGSVRVTAGGQILREGQDYEIDYNIGRIKILNDAYLTSGVPVRVSFEDNAVFGLQNRSMIGLRADYEFNKKVSIGGTYMHLFERPFTQKVNVGDDPINNRILGIDLVYGDDAPWLTRLVDNIPGLSTKEQSTINFTAEAAFLKPGHSKAIDIKKGEGGTVYVDDFEGSASGFDLKTPLAAWTLASVPQNNSLFPEAKPVLNGRDDSLALHANRALLNWYRIDNIGRAGGAPTVYDRQIQPQELFPGRQLNQFTNNALFTFDMTYYPNERGPYNFDIPGGYPTTAGLDALGDLAEPESRWGGIMRELQTNDFQAANIEYLEFWVMSPFLDGANTPDYEGDLYIEFGNISEDIMRDSRLFFENGLPAGTGSNANRPTDNTAFGRVPRMAPVTPAFDTDQANRAEQDLGFDGLNNDGERDAYSGWLAKVAAGVSNPGALAAIQDDPSNDDFESFQSRQNQSTTLGRYKRFNGFEGNSPIASGTGIAVGFSTLPDTEDLNGDNTLSETESYFQYKIPFRLGGSAGEIDPAAARYITQERVIPVAGGADMIWYRFKIPLDGFDAKVGSIQDFRSIRYMRMYMKGFKRPVTFRFARMDLVRNQWRRYLRTNALRDPGPQLPPEPNIFFDVDAINIEENSGREPFSYVLPTGIQREQQINTVGNLQQNEQSQVITVCGLEDGDARGIYKIVNLDMRVYDKLRMFIHAEEFDISGSPIAPEDLENGEMRLFMRLGSDFQDNYYEYELPLNFTRIDQIPVDPTQDELSAAIWPELNNLEINLKDLIALKELRNAEARPLNLEYEIEDPSAVGQDKTMSIKGNPNLGLVKGVMIGLRNPRGGAKQVCAQIWVNELRLNGLDERGGAAGLARLDLQLADFGSISASGSFSSIGWGSLDQKLAERARESELVYDIAGSFEMGKFLPEESGVRVPMTVVYSNNLRQPEFDPYDLDINLKDKIAAADANDRDSIRTQAVNRAVQREINFTNVRKERTKAGGTPLPWDISNFSVSYVYNETDVTSPLIELDETVNHYGSLDYNYALRSKPITPFKKLIKKNKYLDLVKEMNFNPLPSRFGFSTTTDRVLQSTRYRFSGDDPALNTYFNRNWTWDRDYNLNWDFSKGLRFQFNATNRAVIDEFQTFDENGEPILEDVRRDSVWRALRNFGRNKAYQHNFNVNYTLPTKQIPFLEFMNITAQYTGTYNWNAAAQNLTALGNVISNGQQRQIRGDLNFETLYRKSKYLQKIENGNKAAAKKGRGRDPRGRSSGGLDKVASDDSDKKPSDKDDDKSKKGKKEKKKKGERDVSKFERIAIRPFLLIRRANVTYNEEFGTTLPGYTPGTEFLGLSPGFADPGWDFVGGLQPDIRNSFGQNRSSDYLFENERWFTNDIRLNQQVFQTYSQNLAGQMSIEPFKDFRVDLDVSQRYSENHSEFFKDTLGLETERNFARLVPADVGSYTISYGAINTLFGFDPEDLFSTFEDHRLIVSKRLNGELPNPGNLHPDTALANQGFYEGFGPNQQQVQLASFLAAYTDKDPETVSLDVFKTRPKVNWRLTYNGLARVKGMDEIFSSFSLTHSYKSTMTINSFNTNLLYNGPQSINPGTQSFYSKLVIPDLVITEQFSPLIGIDARLKNEMSVRLSLSKTRNLGMSFVDNTLAERNSEEWSVGYGYVIKNVDLLQYFGGKKKKSSSRKQEAEKAKNAANPTRTPRRGGANNGVGNDLDIQIDIRYSDDITLNRQLDQIGNQPTRGATSFTLSPSAEYEINEQLSLRLFLDYRRQTPKVSTSFPTTNTQAGLTVRFKLN